MKTINVRELRSEIPRLRETLAAESELLLVSNGEAIARILPATPVARRSNLPSLKAFRETMAPLKVPTEVLIREDRDRRAS